MKPQRVFRIFCKLCVFPITIFILALLLILIPVEAVIDWAAEVPHERYIAGQALKMWKWNWQ